MPSQQPLRAAIIGCGRMAAGYDTDSAAHEVYTHAKAYSTNESTEFVAACDPDTESVERVASRWGANPYKTADEMLDNEQIDIVSICSPDSTHLHLLDRCLDYPLKAVWCEKPLALFDEDPSETVARYQHQNVLLAVNYIRRSSEQVSEIKNFLSNRRIDTRTRAVVHYSNGFVHSGCHYLDLLLDWFGNVATFEVLGQTDDRSPEDPTLDVRLTFETGAVAMLISHDERDYSADEVDLFHPDARIRLVDYARTVEWYRPRKSNDVAAAVLNSKPDTKSTQFDQLMLRALDRLAQLVHCGQSESGDGASALRVHKLCQRIKTRAIRMAA